MASSRVLTLSRRDSVILAAIAGFGTLSAFAAPPSSVLLQGFWLEPSGGIIQVAACGLKLCATLIAFSRQDGSTLDVNNADTQLRSRPLCGLQLGSGFTSSDDLRAEGGQVYDPKTGKTYSAAMALNGDPFLLAWLSRLRRTKSLLKRKSLPKPDVDGYLHSCEQRQKNLTGTNRESSRLWTAYAVHRPPLEMLQLLNLEAILSQ